PRRSPNLPLFPYTTLFRSNVAQYMLAVGLGAVVYRALGGVVGVDTFSFSLAPFVGLVLTFFVVNQLSVSLAVSVTTGVSVRESLDRKSTRLNSSHVSISYA